MAEELRIVITDQAGAASGAPPAATAPTAPPVQERPVTPEVVDNEQERRASLRDIEGIGGALATGNIRGAASGIGSILKGISAPMAGAVVGVTIAAAGVATALVVAKKALSSFTSTVEAQVTSLARFSGIIARAQVTTQMERFAAQRRRADQLGPGLAAAERLRSRFEITMFDLQTKLLDILLNTFNSLEPFFNAVNNAIESGGQQILRQFELALGTATVLVKNFLRFFRLWDERTREKPEEDFFGDFEKLFPKTPRFFGQAAPVLGNPAVPVGA